MWGYPVICLGIILRLVFADSAEGLPERRLQPASSRIHIQTQENGGSSAFVLSLKITNRIYNQSLEDHNSDDYVKLSDEVINLLQQIFGCLGCSTYTNYEGVSDIAFSNGSVIANSTLVFNNLVMINGDIVKYTFCNALISGPELQTSLDVNPTYTSNLPAPDLVPVPVTTTTPQPTTTSHPSTTTTTTPQPTTTSLSVLTSHQSVGSTTQYYSDISSSTQDNDLSKVTNPSHNISDSTYTSTPNPITDTATSLSSHVTDGLNSSSTTSLKNNSELTLSTTPSSHATNGISSLATTVSENTTDFSKSPPLIITSHTTRGSSKTDSNSSPPKATTSISKPILWSTTSKSGSESTLSHHNTSAISWHPSSHVNTPPKTSTNTTSSHNHSHINILSTIKPNNGSAMAGSSYDGVPGWGIALLVLVSVILLLLIICFILALWFWCCHREETGLINVTGSPKPYDREPSAPEFLTMDPYRKIYPEDFEKPKKNRTGMYVVNP